MPRFPQRAGREVLEGHPRLPEWITRERVRLGDLHAMKTGLRDADLHTVCEEARCPNRAHCFSHGTATFLLLGDTCTRACGFCAIHSGRPLPPNPLEPEETARRVAALGLRFAVLTSVNRDDLADGGADHFAQTIRAIRRLNPGVGVEVLTPDFLGDLEAEGLPAVGLSGLDGGILKAQKRPPVAVDGQVVDFGLVGDVTAVDVSLLKHLIEGGYVPVIAPFSVDETGQVLNTNADTVATELAIALKAEKLFFMLKVPGLLSDPANPNSLVPFADLGKLAELEQSGAIKDGMRPKISATRKALSLGVTSVHFVSGVLPDALLTEVFTNEGSGTMISTSSAS